MSNPKKSSAEKIIYVPLAELHAFHEHPFRVLDDEKMEELIDSSI